MASVKDLRVESEPARDALGRGVFEFSDRYSVFDWGEMPDSIPGKGASLCTMGAFNFELLETEGVPTHYRGVRTPDGDTVDLADSMGLDRHDLAEATRQIFTFLSSYTTGSVKASVRRISVNMSWTHVGAPASKA